MKWLLGALALAVIGGVLRWVLWLNRPKLQSLAGRLVLLGTEREAIYQPIAQEIETQAAILGISLNDAIEERDAGQPEIAWRLVRLALSEWDRLAEILLRVLNVMAKQAATAQVAIPGRSVVADRFKSRVMIDYIRMHELLDQLVFRSRLRFQLHLRLLRRGAESLSAEFRRAYRYADRTEDRPPELWNRLDFYFHDFDLVAKETLLSFRSLLICLPHSTLPGIAADVEAIVRRGVRTTPLASDR